MADPLQLEPRIEELLRNLAADTNSTLLRIPRPTRLSVALGREPAVGIAGAGWTSAELELVRAHREELALLLRQFALVVLNESPLAAVSHTRTNWLGRSTLSETRASWRERALVAAQLNDVADQGDGVRLMMQLLQDADSDRPISVQDVVAAAALFQPTDQGRIFLAQDLVTQGSLERAQRILEEVLAGTPSSANAAAAHTNLGWIETRCGRSASAARSYECAAQLRRDLVPAACGWLTTAIDAVDAVNARRAAEFVSTHLPVDHAGVAESAALLGSQIRAGAAVVTPPSRALARQLTEQFEASTRVICHAYCQ